MQDFFIILSKPENQEATDGSTISLPTWKAVTDWLFEVTAYKVLKVSGDGHWTDVTEDAVYAYIKALEDFRGEALNAHDFTPIYDIFPSQQALVTSLDRATWG